MRSLRIVKSTGGARTPPESLDLNPIENLWHELKEFIRQDVKQEMKDDLVSGILWFWATVDFSKCQKYIRHLDKVIPKIITELVIQLATNKLSCTYLCCVVLYVHVLHTQAHAGNVQNCGCLIGVNTLYGIHE